MKWLCSTIFFRFETVLKSNNFVCFHDNITPGALYCTDHVKIGFSSYSFMTMILTNVTVFLGGGFHSHVLDPLVSCIPHFGGTHSPNCLCGEWLGRKADGKPGYQLSGVGWGSAARVLSTGGTWAQLFLLPYLYFLSCFSFHQWSISSIWEEWSCCCWRNKVNSSG